MVNLLLKYKATILYILFVVFVNSLFMFVPLINIFGRPVSPADITVGSIYILRDFSQREIKSYVLIAMLIAGALSYVFADKTVAFASLSAFLIGELIDWILFTCTKKPLSQRLLLSTICSCPVDSAVFLYFIDRLNWVEMTVLTFFKVIGILIVWGYWRYRRAFSPSSAEAVFNI